MSERNDGGPAFPQLEDDRLEDGTRYVRGEWGGMSLRDWFAGQITAAAITNAQGLGFMSEEERSEQFAGLARISYDLADAMLKARSA